MRQDGRIVHRSGLRYMPARFEQSVCRKLQSGQIVTNLFNDKSPHRMNNEDDRPLVLLVIGFGLS